MRELFQGRVLDHPENSIRILLRQGVSAYDAGDFAVALGEFLAAEALLRSRVSDGPATSEEYATLAELIGVQADCEANQGDLDRALELLDDADAALSLGGDIAPAALMQRLMLQDRRAFYLSWSGRCDRAAFESESVVRALHKLAANDPRYSPDLARSLDHRAEILDRAHQHREALAAAKQSVEMRRDLAEKDKQFDLPFLRSLVTQARLEGILGRGDLAVEHCDEGLAVLNSMGEGTPSDLYAQFLACRGRALATIDKRPDGVADLKAAEKIFASLCDDGSVPSVFADIRAELFFEMGRICLEDKPDDASDYFCRGRDAKQKVSVDIAHPWHRVRVVEAETWVIVGEINRGSGDLADLEAILAEFGHAIYLPLSAPRLALEISRVLLRIRPEADLSQVFHRLAIITLRAIDVCDDEYLDELDPIVSGFQALWLAHFIDAEDGPALLTWLIFVHGRRLAAVAASGGRCRGGVAGSTPEKRFHDLRQRIYRIDLEMDEVLSGRSYLRSEMPAPRAGVVSIAAEATGAALVGIRDRLYSEYLALLESGLVPSSDVDMWRRLPTPAEVVQSLQSRESRVLVWCVPEGVPDAFGKARPPVAVLVDPEKRLARLLIVPELRDAGRAFSEVTANLAEGRAAARGEPLVQGARSGRLNPSAEACLWEAMDCLWRRFDGREEGQSISGLDVVTHGEAHNLPWLGSCPKGVRLAQFPSLNFLLERRKARSMERPTKDRPLAVVWAEDQNANPRWRLYHAPLEVEIIRQIWGGAVVVVTPDRLDESKHCGLWIIGHGLTDTHGHPMLGTSNGEARLEDLGLLDGGESSTRFLYASTCFLGSTFDSENEPLGLASLAAIRSEGRISVGAVAPVDDLGAALLALLFHVYWNDGAEPRMAFEAACRALLSGAWPAEANEVLLIACNKVFPAVIDMAKNDLMANVEQVAVPLRGNGDQSPREAKFLIRTRALDFLSCWGGLSTKLAPADRCAHLTAQLCDRRAIPSAFQLRTWGAAKFWAWFG